MADRIVYLVDKLPRGGSDASVEVVDDDGFSKLVASGFEVVSQMEGRTVTLAGKKHKATMMVLRPAADNRAVSRSRDSESDDAGPVRNEVIQVRDEFGVMRPMSQGRATVHAITRALQDVGAPGHLGPTKNHDLPGISIISGEVVGKAFDVGLGAAKRGDPVDTCPFPSGSAAHTLWMQGYRKAASAGPVEVSQQALDRAYQEGRSLAESLGREDEVHCPYTKDNPCYRVWCKGFTDGGGIIKPR